MTVAEKIGTLEEVAARAEGLRAEGKKVAHCHGVFDLLHIGHLRHLKGARQLADILVVTITPDRFVNKGPGRPAFTETLRAEALAMLECVDLVAIFLEMRATGFLELAAPDVYVKGGDYNQDTLNAAEREVLQKIGAKIDIVPFEPGYSTTDLLSRLSEIKK